MMHELTTYSVAQLVELYEQKRLILRKTEIRQVREIRNYIIEQFGDGNIFFPPIVASKNGDVIYVIDGSSRLRAIFDLLDYIPKLELSKDERELTVGIQLQLGLLDVTLAIQLYDNLDEQTRNQVYLDQNTKGKKVALSKRIAYDSRNAINIVTNEILQQHTELLLAGVEQEKVSLNRPTNKKFLSLSQLRLLVSLFITGKEQIQMVRMKNIDEAYIEGRLPLIMAWLDELFALEPAQNIGNYEMSMLANFTVVRALAYYALVGEKQVEQEQKEPHIRQRMQALKHISWESRQALWEQFDGTYRGKQPLYYISKDKQTLAALINWLTFEGGGHYVKA